MTVVAIGGRTGIKTVCDFCEDSRLRCMERNVTLLACSALCKRYTQHCLQNILEIIGEEGHCCLDDLDPGACNWLWEDKETPLKNFNSKATGLIISCVQNNLTVSNGTAVGTLLILNRNGVKCGWYFGDPTFL